MEKTIAAISTAQAPGGIGIIRISGVSAKEVASKIFIPKQNKSIKEAAGYTALFGYAVTLEGEKIDTAIALIFHAPKSYTGEDVVEISCHGGLWVMQRILRETFKAGASPAQPGEFTKRAFLNGKMDLAEAEAVMELIGAKSADAARVAAAGNEGVLTKRLNNIKKSLVEAAAHLSAWADYPEDEIPEITEEDLRAILLQAIKEVESLLKSFESGRAAREGVRTVIVGKPNVGKSTIMNLLSGYERSIVTEYAGTTRDIVEESIVFGGIPLYIADTAGIHDTEDPVEKIGVERAKQVLQQAQLLLAVFDSSREISDEDMEIIHQAKKIPSIALINKTDLPKQMQQLELDQAFSKVVFLSAKNGEGMEELERAIKDVLKVEAVNPSNGILYTERQYNVASRLCSSLKEAYRVLSSGITFDAVTIAVEESISILMELTGERVSETVVDAVFSKFCVGK